MKVARAVFTDTVTGLPLDVRVWTLVVHQADGGLGVSPK